MFCRFVAPRAEQKRVKNASSALACRERTPIETVA